jgi:hypothetical protein
MTRAIGLSKSKITLFEQCPKRLWLSVHKPEAAEEDSGMRAGFAEGHRVGELACALYPDGVMITADQGLAKAVDDIRRHSRQSACAFRPSIWFAWWWARPVGAFLSWPSMTLRGRAFRSARAE